MSSLEVLGHLIKVVYLSDDSAFSVAEFVDSKTARAFKASGTYSVNTQASKKQTYRLIGEWQSHAKYGEYFHTVYCEPVLPVHLSSLEVFLSDNVKGIGQKTAKKLVAHLSVSSLEDFVRICQEEKERIYQFFSTKKQGVATKVIAIMAGDQVFRSVMIFLHEHNIPPHFAKKIYDKYGENAVKNLKENPYRLISDFRRVGFIKADAVAKKLGFAPKAPSRIEAACIYTLEKALEEGHCRLPVSLVRKKLYDLFLKIEDTELFTEEELLQILRHVYLEQKKNDQHSFVVLKTEQDTYFYLPEILTLEKEVASLFKQLRDMPGTEAKEMSWDLEDLKKINPSFPWENLSEEQLTAVKTSVSSKTMILTGGPGCGKTFVLRAIYLVQRYLNRQVLLCAPTGLAAKRMTQSIGAQAITIHKAFKLGKSGNEDDIVMGSDKNILQDVDIVIIDETSMIGLDLFYRLLSPLVPKKRLILVGDVEQLPSISAGHCLRDLIQSGALATVHLTKIFRQSSESPIPILAQSVVKGATVDLKPYRESLPLLEPKKIAFLESKPDTFFPILEKLLTEDIPYRYGLDAKIDCQILVPLKKGSVGQDAINLFVQNLLNPASEHKKEFRTSSSLLLREGDKIIQTRNNYELEVFNGDLGICKKIIKGKEETEVLFEFSDKSVAFEEDDLDDIQLAYAMTVHKSQGSEFKLCILPIFSEYYVLLNRNLIYTAITRAKESLILIGEPWALQKSIKTANANKRHTGLLEFLKS